MKQILIKFPDDMPDNKALCYVENVVCEGKISKNGKCYCFVTEFVDHTVVSVNERAKYPTFRIWRKDNGSK